MNAHESQLPRVDSNDEVTVEAAVDTAVEQAEQTPAEQADALQTRLENIVEANNTLEGEVDDTTREAVFEYAADHPSEAEADARVLENSLPKTDGPQLAEVAGLAKAKVEEIANMPDAESKGIVDAFCQKHFGGSLADVAAACGDMMMPGSDIFRAVMKGEMPKGRDLARLASGMIAPPIGTAIFDMVLPKQGGTPAEIKQAAIKGRLSADLIRAVGFFLPEVATVTEPASKVMRSVSDEVEKTAKKGDTNTADRTKAIGRGLMGAKENAKKIAEGLGMKMTTDAALEAAGITGDSAETIKAVGRVIAENPDKAGELLNGMFADDGGIVEKHEPFQPGPFNDGGIVEQYPSGTPDGAIS